MENRASYGSPRFKFAIVALALLLLALFMPVSRAPIVGPISPFNMSDGAGYYGVALVAFGGLMLYLNRLRLLAIPGVVVLISTLWYVYRFEDAKVKAGEGLQGNPFAGLAQGLMSSVKLEFGIFLLLLAGVALLLVAFMREASGSTLAALVSANKRLVL
jgi:hypothetical protein